MTDSEIPPNLTMTSIGAAIARMQEIDATLPGADGVACFNRMYLGVTEQVQHQLTQGLFSDPAFMESLDVAFANIYFGAVDAAADPTGSVPPAWQPLIQARSDSGVYPLQFALAGMNAHINHDLPVALVETCTQLDSAPDDGSHHADYQKVDALLDAAEQSVRQSFESGTLLQADRSAQAVIDLVDNWSITSARDVAWDTAVALWRCRAIPTVEDLLMNALARTVAMASRCLLVTL